MVVALFNSFYTPAYYNVINLMKVYIKQRRSGNMQHNNAIVWVKNILKNLGEKWECSLQPHEIKTDIIINASPD
jgi:hypothetical protein